MDKPNVISLEELTWYVSARDNHNDAEEQWGKYKKSMFALAEYFVKQIYDRKFARIDSIGDVELEKGVVRVEFTYSEDSGSTHTAYIPMWFLTGDWESVDEAIQAFKDYTKKKSEELVKEQRKLRAEYQKKLDAEREEEEKKEYIRLKKKYSFEDGIFKKRVK